jgi:hypothetical protein
LRSWTPRRPSAKIATNLFVTESAPEKKRPAFSWNWLAPATAAVFTMLVVFGAHPHSPASLGQADTNLFFASITMDNATSFTSSDSLKTAFNLSKSDLNLEQNVWRSASFESTNLSQSPSSSRSLPMFATNSLMR